MALSFNNLNHHGVGVYQNLHTPALIIGGSFVVLSIFLSCWLILQHLRCYTNPAEQKWIIGVLLMVPVYASESIISLWNSKFSIACDILRNCYEAFALYSFGRYLVACMGGERSVIGFLESRARKQINEPLVYDDDEETREGRRLMHDFFCQPGLLGEDFYTVVKFGIVQYMILKTLCAFLSLILEIFGVYGDGEFKWYYGYPYIAVILNFSQMWALYCLVQFYSATHHKLRHIKPLAKFISFKAIVFATWWQGVGIAAVCHFGVLPNEEKIQNGIQDFLICVEVSAVFFFVRIVVGRFEKFGRIQMMAIAAVAHMFVFSERTYRYVPTTMEYGKITMEETRRKRKVKLEDSGEEKPAIIEEKETRIEAAGTSVTESVQDVVFGGGGYVVEDVVLTIGQAVGPVEKGVTKIHEKLQNITVKHDNGEEEEEVVIKEHIEEEM